MIAVVDAFSSGVHLVRALPRVGADVVHVRSADRLDDYYEATFRSELVSFELGFAPETRQLRALRTLSVDRVLPGTESGVSLAESLAARLGVPTNAPHLAGARRDKYEMVHALRAAGVPAPRSFRTSSADEAASWCAREALERAVVKPLGSAGSDNVRVCAGRAQVHEAVDQVLGSLDLFGRPNRAVLVQEFLAGPEFYVNAVSTASGHHPVEIWQYTKSDGPAGTRLFDHEDPVRRGGPIWDQLWSYSLRALDALGFRHGPSHLEMILSGGRPLLIDPAARLGGGVLPEVNEQLTGTSHALETAMAAVDHARIARVAVYPETTRYLSLVNRDAGVPRHSATDEFASLRTTIAVHGTTHVDAVLPVTTGLLSSPGFVYLHGDYDDVVADQATIRRREAEGCYTEPNSGAHWPEWSGANAPGSA